MREAEVSADEKAALDVIRAVEDVVRAERLTPSDQGGTADWRLEMTDGRVVDVEVTRAADAGTRSLLAAGHNHRWRAPELSHEWTVQISDLAPERNRSLKELMEVLTPALRRAEDEDGTTGEMASRARELLTASSPPPHSTGLPGVAWLLGRAVAVCGCKPAEPSGGSITTFVSPAVGGNLSITVDLAAAVQGCIDDKQQSGQLEAAPGLRWLVVVLDEFTLAPMQLRAFAEDVLDESHTVSAGDEAPESAAQLDEVTFPGMDEVWAFGPSRAGKWVLVLRLKGTGSNWRLRALESAAVLGEDWYAVPGLSFWRS